MSREWKPGDVALVKVDGREGEVLGLRDTVGWATNRTDRQRSHAHWTNAEYVTPVRPLVVIDPEDREAVERLRDLFDVEVIRQNDDPDPRDVTPGARGNALQAALREFANPAPPKPEEPTGLGAVVEDEDGVTWVRAGKTHGGRMHDHWRCVDGEHVGYWVNWDRLAAVRVLSEGVR